MTPHRCLLTFLLLYSLYLGGCSAIAVAVAPNRTAAAASTDTEVGTRLFQDALRQGDYEGLPDVIEELTRLAIANPLDGQIHTSLGMAHLWRVSERVRDPDPSPRLTEHVVLSRHYLRSAEDLLPDDARVHAWSAGAQLATASLLSDARAQRAGYFAMQRGIRRYPEFNLFSASFVFSRLPFDHPRYESQVVDNMFEAVRRCYGRADTWEERRETIAVAMAEQELPTDESRVCYPSPYAPHNIEGFFMHFGDALSKAGRLDDAVQAWQLANLAPGYSTWPYREQLEARINDPEAHYNVARAGSAGEGMMITSAYSCSGCHQE